MCSTVESSSTEVNCAAAQCESSDCQRAVLASVCPAVHLHTRSILWIRVAIIHLSQELKPCVCLLVPEDSVVVLNIVRTRHFGFFSLVLEDFSWSLVDFGGTC